ncbi:elongation factor Ts, mitochondrial [Testicularia cyperi]|uniref:Elongation factor Ts, mitochondrial n=1 Tax=Testicularia cyperi TaxID=1882483 RepID=A0A317XXN2_9BASI|nr:elongation factor Ts, mitochondrial [Testicularia cyperi]
MSCTCPAPLRGALRVLRSTGAHAGPSTRTLVLHQRRLLSSSSLVLEPKKPSIKAIAELRKLMPGTSMLKAKEALLASRSESAPDEDSISAALQWLEEDRKKSGAKKADKVASRSAREGVVAVSILSDGLPSSVELNAKLSSEAQQSGLGATQPARGAIVEVNCETDFVAKNEVFVQLVKDIVHTAALFPSLALDGQQQASSQTAFVDVPVEALLSFPLLPSSPEAQASSAAPKTVSSAIIDVVSRLGEKISIARAAAIVGPAVPSPDAPRRSESGTSQGSSILDLASAFAHGGSAGFSAPKDAARPGYLLTSGRVASLLVTRFASPSLPDLLAAKPDSSSMAIQDSIRALTRSLARQTAGMQTTSIRAPDASSGSQAAPPGESADVSTALYDQPFMMLLPTAAPSPDSNANTVQKVLADWASTKGISNPDAVHVTDMKRWELGETAEPVETNADAFADEVRKAAGLA